MIRKAAFIVAIALTVFSGSVSCIGLTHLAPGSEVVIFVMAALFECAKVVVFSVVPRATLPPALRAGLLALGLVLVALNFAGMAGLLSSHLESELATAHATSHTAQAQSAAAVSTLQGQLSTADTRVAQATASLGKAHGDRQQIKAMQTVLSSAVNDRDRVANELLKAQAAQAQADGNSIKTESDVAAAISFIATGLNVTTSTAAHIFIGIVAALPDLLAISLLMTATHLDVERAGEKSPAASAEPALKLETVEHGILAAVPAAIKHVSTRKQQRLSARQRGALKAWETRRANAARQQHGVAKLVKA